MMPTSQPCSAHDHDCSAADCGPAFSLYKHIDMPRVSCLNEAEAGTVVNIFKPWDQRLQPTVRPLCSNEDDPELLIHVPFDGAVKLKAIAVVGGLEGSAPAHLKVFINRDDVDFSLAETATPVQEWALQEDTRRVVLEYPTLVSRFNGVHSIDMYFKGNFGADFTEIHFIGLKGDFTERRRQAVEAVYEARAMPSDHKVPEVHGAHFGV
ncbi:hypothetical protein CEUSTIGMA_g11255.t1 [Chlamydomonas eustigma]|uniref:PITH domain-containing protein n=1 Tax=Chlamydomonas eustigma TaxID=1157962 RepID=A0A250XL51_9CHLO|nr:hypothetical protein CEUSTIGMA_g11255.t1 [Chlamydomonas eustigma]|eukprot:GAX83831.1 hypothetical protein CEUSTIGMA_g11255.t1 [Chlamydomonas eustigma]